MLEMKLFTGLEEWLTGHYQAISWSDRLGSDQYLATMATVRSCFADVQDKYPSRWQKVCHQVHTFASSASPRNISEENMLYELPPIDVLTGSFGAFWTRKLLIYVQLVLHFRPYNHVGFSVSCR